jgi:cob(I)alamin adenosyltransferase
MIPTWVADGTELPFVASYAEALKDSPICYAALELKNKKILNIRWGEKDNSYINVNALANNEGTGIRQILKKYETEIYKKAYILNEKAAKDATIDKKSVKEFYKWLDLYIKEIYKKEFDINI